jgi:hypothetical protein
LHSCFAWSTWLKRTLNYVTSQTPTMMISLAHWLLLPPLVQNHVK